MKKQSEYKWLILTSVVVSTMTHFTLMLTFGTLYLPMMDTYNEDRYTTSTVQSLFLGVSFSFSVICGVFISRFGVFRIAIAGSVLSPLGFLVSFFAKSIVFLDISIGVISAIGICCIHISNSTALGLVFSGSQKQIAISLQYTAISVAGILYPYLLRWLVHTYALSGTFLILCGILLNNIPVALLYAYDESLNPKAKTSEQPKVEGIENEQIIDSLDESVHASAYCVWISHTYSKSKQFLKELFTMKFVLVLIATASLVAFLNSNTLIIIDIFVTKGFSRAEGVASFIPFSILGFIARILPGIVKLKKGFNSMILPIVYSFCGFVGQLLIYASSNYAILLVGCGLSGISLGGVISAASSILVKILRTNQFAVGFGLLHTIMGILIAIIGPFYGALRDATGSYDIVQLTTAGIQLMAIVFFILALIVRRKERLDDRLPTIGAIIIQPYLYELLSSNNFVF